VQRGAPTETYALHAPIVRLARQAGLESVRNARLPYLVRGLSMPGQWTVPHLRRALDPDEHSELDTPATMGLDRVRERLDEYIEGTGEAALADLFEGMLDDMLALAPDTDCDLDVAMTGATVRLCVTPTVATAERIEHLTTSVHETVYNLSLANALAAVYVVEAGEVRRRSLAGRLKTVEAIPTAPGLTITLRLDPVLVDGRFAVSTARALLGEYAADDPALTVRFNGDPITG
jgi:hypothetical protein